MRLIDADELIEMAYRMRLDSREQIACMIESAPTIEPEQKRGRWIKDCNVAFYWKCSECGAYLFWRKEDYLLRENDNPNYCPNCGARMEGDTA